MFHQVSNETSINVVIINPLEETLQYLDLMLLIGLLFMQLWLLQAAEADEQYSPAVLHPQAAPQPQKIIFNTLSGACQEYNHLNNSLIHLMCVDNYHFLQ